MAESRIRTIHAILRPKLVKVGGISAISLGAYDAASSQFGFPKLGKVLGMSGTLLPWWGWVLILQAVFVYGLFEYVRRIPQSPGSSESTHPVGVVNDTALALRSSEKRITGVQERIAEILVRNDQADRAMVFQKDETNALIANHERKVINLKGLIKALNDINRIRAKGLFLLSWMAPNLMESEIEWENLKNEIKSLPAEIYKLPNVQPDEGFWLPYFTGEHRNQFDNPVRSEVEKRVEEYEGHRLFIRRGLQLISQSETYILNELERLNG